MTGPANRRRTISRFQQMDRPVQRDAADLGLGLAIVDLFLLFKHKRSPQLEVRYDPIADPRLIVALTAYDDEVSIADAVRDFRSHPLIDEVIA